MKAAVVLLGQPWIEELNGAHDGDEAKPYTFKRQYHRLVILISAKPIEQKSAPKLQIQFPCPQFPTIRR